MKRVLIIGSDFAPSSLPPATRIRFFATHLHEFGWQPIVLTTDPKHYESSVDEENRRLVPDWLEVIRTPALPVSLTRKIGIGDVGIRSLWHHWRALSKLSKEKRIDLILLPSPPAIPLILGRLANIRFRIPYVVDYIDPWVTNYYWQLPRKQRPPKWILSYVTARCLEPFVLGRVSHITGVSRGTTEQVTSRYNWLSSEHATEIPYGAEAGDFDYVRENPRENIILNANDGYLHLSYIGAYAESMRQTLTALFNAFKKGLDRNPNVFELVRMHFVGTTYSTNGIDPFRVTRVARECGVEKWVTEHPQRVAYLDSLQVILQSHFLVLLGSDEPHYTASKVFPYILAERPLLAIFHEESSAISVLRETNCGFVVKFNSAQGPLTLVDEISTSLEEMFTANSAPIINWAGLEPYTTRAMARRLAGALDKALGQAC
jgi:hypothetical protein